MLKNNSRHIRKFYFPGLISLLCLPALSFWFISNHKSFEKLYALDIAFWSPSLQKIFPESFRHGSHPPRKYLKIDLSGNDKEDQVKLDFAQIQIRDLVATNDVKNGVHFKLGNKSKYWGFIRALDICKTGAKTYVPYGSDIWVFNILPKKGSDVGILKEKFRFFCGTSQMAQTSEQEEEDVLFPFFKESIKKYCIPLLLFLAMTFFGLRALLT